MEITITIPDSLTIESRGQEVVLDTTKVALALHTRALVHGWGQKVADAAASATTVAAIAAVGEKPEGMTRDEYLKRLKAWADNDGNSERIAAMARTLMVKAIDKIYAGEWAAPRGRTAGATYDMTVINFAINIYAAKLAHDIPGFDKLKAAEKRDAVNGWLDAKDGRRAAIAAKVAAERAALDDI